MKILAIFTGGTIGCSKVGGVLSPNSENSFVLLDMYRQMDDSVSFTAAQPYTILSENLRAENLTALYDCVKSYDLSAFDGVIAAHGTDTLQYSAAYLAFKLGLCETPVVLVSANFPLSDARSNGVANFRAAVDFIKAKQGSGVFAAYQNSGDSFVNIHRATRILPHLPYSDSLFSMFGSVYGIVKDGKFAANSEFTDDDFTKDFSACELNGTVLFIKSHVGMSYPRLEGGVKAVLLEGYHSGTLNTESEKLREFCAKAAEKEIPVFLTGACCGFDYESKLAFERLKIKTLLPMSPIAAYVKLWLCDLRGKP